MTQHGGKFLSDALASHWQKYRKRLKTCRKDVSEDNVHELRISTRRLLALVELIRTLLPHASLKGTRKILKHLLDSFDELRDTQVMLLEIAGSLPNLPELSPFMGYLQEREQQLLQQTGPHIAGLEQGKLRRKIQKAGRRFKSRTAKTDLHASVLGAIDGVYALTLERYRAVDAADLTSIHHLRISLKKLRYMLISVQSLIPGLPDSHLKRLQNYLTRMGDIQNSSVLLRTLEAFFGGAVPANIRMHYQKQQQDLIDGFMAHREEIFEFWRSSPDRALPWAAGELET
ncbi:MAG: CHAD domain-containing protein [Methylomonas sp.]